MNPDRPRHEDDSRKGLVGFYGRILRRFNALVHATTLVPLYLLACAALGVALAPGVELVRWALAKSDGWSIFLRAPAVGAAIAAGYFLYGFCAIVVVPALNFVMRTRPKPWRGSYYSLGAVPWYIHNGLTYLVRYTFLELITPSPFNLFFYRAMGMKIGRGAQINSTHISDPALIELGEHATIGGSATIVGHYGMGGYLVLAPVRIGARATVGLKAIVMGGVVVGEGARIMPNSVLLPKTVVPAGEVWGGVPACKIEAKTPVRDASDAVVKPLDKRRQTG